MNNEPIMGPDPMDPDFQKKADALGRSMGLNPQEFRLLSAEILHRHEKRTDEDDDGALPGQTWMDDWAELLKPFLEKKQESALQTVKRVGAEFSKKDGKPPFDDAEGEAFARALEARRL